MEQVGRTKCKLSMTLNLEPTGDINLDNVLDNFFEAIRGVRSDSVELFKPLSKGIPS